MTLKEKLLNLGILEDNEYLNKYCVLIESNRETKMERFKTQRHHIVPRCYYKNKGLKVDNSKDNLVNLLYKEHILAHCYLSMCAKEPWFKYANLISIYKIFGSVKQYKGIEEKALFEQLEEVQQAYQQGRETLYEFNPMFDDNLKLNHDAKMRTEETRNKISNTMKHKAEVGELFDSKHRENLSKAQKDMVYIYKDNKISRIHNKDLDMYLSQGWAKYEKRSYAQRCGREMMTPKENVPMFATRNNSCYCILNSGERYDFESIRNATIWWFNTFHPFGDKYAECTLQRKIKASARGEQITYLAKCNSSKKHEAKDNEVKIINNIKWYINKN